MRIKLKTGEKLRPIKNKYGLGLGDFMRLQAGQTIEIKDVPKDLKGIVDEIKVKEKK
jgi:hypothetical protein